MDNHIIKQELSTTAWNTINVLKKLYSGYFDKYTIIVMDKYSNQITNSDMNSQKYISPNYNIDELINATIDDYKKNHDEINLEEIKSNFIKLLLNILLELQYKINNKSSNIELSNMPLSTYTEDHFKIAFLNSNPNIMKDLLISGMSEVIARDIGEKLDIEITKEFNEEYKFVLETKKLLDNKYDLLLNGNLNEIFNKLGDKYKNSYLINTVNHHFRNMSEKEINKLGLSYEEINMLLINLGIDLPIKEVEKQKEEITKAEQKMGLNDVNYINAKGTQYVKLNGEEQPIFAEIIGNITPKERLEQIKDNNPKEIIKADDLKEEVEKEMITTEEFEDTNKKIPEENHELKINTRTGLFINENGEAYSLENNRMVQLNNSGGIEEGYNMNINEDIKNKLIEYDVYEKFLASNSQEQAIILSTYGLTDNQKEESISKDNGYQKTITFKKIDRNGYVSSFILVFSIGVLAGIISTVLLNIAR